MRRVPNPLRLLLVAIGRILARFGLIEAERARRTVDLAWPRIVTGLARMSKSAVDVAMVGVAVGPAAIAGVGFAGPYWGLAFTTGGGLAAGTIALVAQGFGADASERIGRAVRSSVVLVIVLTLPMAVAFWTFPEALIGILTGEAALRREGAAYLKLLALGVPFAGLNLIGSRTLVGADVAWSAMVIRAGGAVANIALNAVFIFGLGLGVVGAAGGTVLANVFVTAIFVVGLTAGRLPGIGALPVTISPRGRYVDLATIRDIVEISTPVVGRNLVWTVARFPMLAFVALFGSTVVAAYVVARRVWMLMNAPGWGFGLAASSLVGQSLGADDETTAEDYAREITRFAVATYAVGAAIVLVFAEPIVGLFVGESGADTIPIAVPLVWAAAFAVVAQGVNRTLSGALDATGDTNWPFYGRALGMFGVAIPVVYLGVRTPLGMWGLYLAFFAQTVVPAAVVYYRFSTGKWKAISRQYRPDAALGD